MSEVAERESESGYRGLAIFNGVLATLVFPVIALFAALVLHVYQDDRVKQKQLRWWALLSFVWIVPQLLLVLSLTHPGSQPHYP